MELLLSAVEVLVPMSLAAIAIVLIAVQFLPAEQAEIEE
jgi:hypothetical protein